MGPCFFVIVFSVTYFTIRFLMIGHKIHKCVDKVGPQDFDGYQLVDSFLATSNSNGPISKATGTVCDR